MKLMKGQVIRLDGSVVHFSDHPSFKKWRKDKKNGFKNWKDCSYDSYQGRVFSYIEKESKLVRIKRFWENL